MSVFAKRFLAGRWSFFGLGSETKWFSTYNERPQGQLDRVAELMMIQFSESGHPDFRATSPLSRGTLKSKGGGKLSIHFCADGDTIETVFRTIISVNQLSICGEVSDLCEEYGSCRTRTGRLVVTEQSDPLFEPADLLIMTPTPSIEILAQENLLQKFKERVEKLPQPGRLIKICTDAGFLKAVETRRLTRKVGFKGTPKLDPFWKSQPVTYKVNMEWKSELNRLTKTILTRGSEFLMT